MRSFDSWAPMRNSGFSTVTRRPDDGPDKTSTAQVWMTRTSAPSRATTRVTFAEGRRVSIGRRVPWSHEVAAGPPLHPRGRSEDRSGVRRSRVTDGDGGGQLRSPARRLAQGRALAQF